MADDSELDYLRTFLTYACLNSTVKHFSEVKKISAINDTRRILVFPGELISVDGKFYTKRYKIKISETSEANLMETFNNIINTINGLGRGTLSVYYTGVSFDVSDEDAAPRGICWDGTHFWIIGLNVIRAYKYTAAGVYTGTSFDVSGEDFDSEGICWDGTYFWVVGDINNRVYKYTAAGVYTGTSFDVSGEDTEPRGVEWDGTHFWVVGTNTDRIYKYNSAGVYQSVSFDVSDEDGYPRGICWDGTHFWILGTNTDRIYKYTAAGVYTGTSFDVSDEATDPRGNTWDGTHFWVTGTVTKRVYKYNRVIYLKPSVLVYITLKYGNKAYEVGSTKRWYQDIYLDVEWSTE